MKDLRGEIEGRDVLLVEDIVDTGYTLKHVLEILGTRHPRRIEVCALLEAIDQYRPHVARASLMASRLGLRAASGMTDAMQLLGLPAQVPMRHGVARFVDRLQSAFPV